MSRMLAGQKHMTRKGCFMRKIICAVIVVMLSGFFMSQKILAASRLQETAEKTVIVIDPGHGGENRGTIENNH